MEGLLLAVQRLITFPNDMHELAITESILSIALEQAKAAQASRITQINLTIGELSGIVDECVEFYFDLLNKDTIAAEASLCFERTQTRLRCRHCDTTFSPNDLDWACPNCRERQIEIISGRECYVSSIEVD
jgi:hydrogenase nickel incorporation protein HypA/HybF